MPIDPSLLRSRAAALTEQVYDPPALAASVRALLDDYADRAHRASPRLSEGGLAKAYKAPAPVVRAIVTALRGFAQASPHATLALLRAFWEGESREERRIAAELLGLVAPQCPTEAMLLIEAWLPGIESSESADALAEYGLGPLMRADPAAHLPNAQRWARHPSKWTRRFGLAALTPLVKDKKWDNVPGVFQVLHPVMTDSEPEVRAAAIAILRGLVPKSPVEVGRFLREQAERDNHNTQAIIRAVMLRLAPEIQAELSRLMRA